MRYDFDIAILGGGSGGLVVAAGAAAIGAKAVLFEAEHMGGDCLNYGCVPSKSFLYGAHGAHFIKNGKEQGVYVDEYKTDIPKLMQYVQNVVRTIAPHDSAERFEALGVKVVRQFAKLKDAHTVEAGGLFYTAKSIVIATGSKAFIPPIKGLESTPYFTNHDIFSINYTPSSLIILGAGPIGLELGQGFAHFKTKVTVIDKMPTLFGKDDPFAGEIMQKVLQDDGMEFCLSANIISVEKSGELINVHVEVNGEKRTHTAQALLVSTGRRAQTSELNLQNIGVELLPNGALKVNKHLQSTVKNIYACGDAAGPYLFTHTAAYQAGIVLQNAALGTKASTNYNSVPWCTYTKPEVAHVGLSQIGAQKNGIATQIVTVDFKENDRAVAESDTSGALKLVLNKKGVIIGATIVGNKAGELLAFACLAIHAKMKLSSLNSLILPYPTQSEIFKTAASKYRKENVKAWQLGLLRRIIRSRNK